MWLDLDPENIELLPPYLHPLLGELFGGRTPEPAEADDLLPDPKARDAVPILVLDADSSQYAAMAAVLSGRNLVIQGPPGTGKSQTIANTIAAAMWQGKTVLFVAEKLVALQVVHKRLAEAHLGDFILELHSAKAGKKPLIESIRKRIKLNRPAGRHVEHEATRALHRNSADALDAYAAAMNAPFGSLGYLQFARSGRLESGLTSGRSTDNPFEDAVMGALRSEGFECEPQVGVAGFWIDLAVRSPADPDYFIIGIECDGAAYHSSRAARDRDRLRQQILENLGWTIYRVWSTDWFANPRHELRKLVSAIREQVHNNPVGASEPTLPFLRRDKPSVDESANGDTDPHKQ